MVYGAEAVAFGACGMLSGLFVPALAEKTAGYKCAGRQTALPEDGRYTGVIARGGCAVLNGGLWVAAGLGAGGFAAACVLCIVLTLGLLIAIIDIRIRIIPNELVTGLCVAGVAFQYAYAGSRGVLFGLLSALAAMLLFAVASAISGPGKVGAGDVKLAGAMAVGLGYPGILYALLVMSAAMLIYCAVGLLTRRLQKTSMFPFGPFLILGMECAFLLIITVFS